MGDKKVRRGTAPKAKGVDVKDNQRGAPPKAQVGRCPVCNKLVALGSMANHIGSANCR